MKNKTISIIITVIFTLLFLFSTFYLFYLKIHSSSNTFTFAWMSDTQYYSESHPEIFDMEVNYILDYRDRSNIKYAIHTGDIVDDMKKTSQWINANNSLKLFDDSDMPYGVLAGNHGVSRRVDELDDNHDGMVDRKVYSVLADYQYIENGGNGYIRLIEFDPENHKINFKTYSPKLHDYNCYDNNVIEKDEYGYKDEFSLPFD